MDPEKRARWDALTEQESQAAAVIGPELAPLEPAVAMLHDLGARLIELPGEWPDDEHLLFAAGALKRALDDLRAAWLLLNQGYTAAAAAVIADLWEHGMAAACSARDPKIARAYLESDANRPGPSASNLSRRLVEIELADEDASEEELRTAADTYYGTYKWLCQWKHTTPRALFHTTMTTVTGRGELDPRAAPDSRVVDLDMKKALLWSALLPLQRAMVHLGVGNNVDNAATEKWCADLDEVRATLEREAPRDDLKLQFTIGDWTRSKVLRARSGASA